MESATSTCNTHSQQRLQNCPKKTMIPTYMYQTKHMYSEGKCTSLYDLFQNNNISGHDIHTIFWMIYLKQQLKYTPYIHNSMSLTYTPLHKAIAYTCTCTYSLHTHRSRSLTQKEMCTSLGPARWGSAGTASVELWPVHWWLLPWRRDSSSVGSRCPWPVWHRSLYHRRPGQLAVSITCNMIPRSIWYRHYWSMDQTKLVKGEVIKHF